MTTSDMRTERLILRPLEPRDAPCVAALAGDWDVARMTARIPHPYTLIDADQWIGGLARGEFVRAIEHEGEVVGVCGYIAGEDGSAEIGYWIGKPYWGRGIATEAGRALIAYCFQDAGFERLTCCHFVDNPASQRVIAKLGFRRVGRSQGWCEARQQEVATLTYERRRALASRWRARAA
jgi:RimJ/RimL family protein N-acetyltransferase